MEKAGHALILDSMVFLTVAAVVSVSIVAANSMDEQRTESLQDLVDDAHMVLLRTTITIGHADRYDRLNIFDLSIAYAINHMRGMDLGRFELALEEIEILLDGILPETVYHSWSITFNGTNLSLGRSPEMNHSTWISEMTGELPIFGSEFLVRLIVWYC